MDTRQFLILLCGVLLVISPVLIQAQQGNRPNRARPQNRGSRGRGNQRNPNRRPGRRGGGRGSSSTIPVSTSTECEPIQVPMCRGMVGYTHTRLPNQFGHESQSQVYRALEYMWAFMDIGCSSDFRTTACGFYLPKCTPGETAVELPCKETCNRARKCKKRMRQLQSRWPTEFRCRSLKSYRQGGCLPPSRRAPSCQQHHVTCERNPIPMCQNLTFAHGSLPNMFLQCNTDEIESEIEQFHDLIESNCSPHTRFFICGIYMPFCVRAETPFALPCQEICEAVRVGCEPVYRRNRGGLAWPNKFQCHRYPPSTNTQQVCASPSDVTLRTPDIQQPARNSTSSRNGGARSGGARSGGARSGGRRRGGGRSGGARNDGDRRGRGRSTRNRGEQQNSQTSNNRN